jgi:hypothetical protein
VTHFLLTLTILFFTLAALEGTEAPAGLNPCN